MERCEVYTLYKVKSGWTAFLFSLCPTSSQLFLLFYKVHKMQSHCVKEPIQCHGLDISVQSQTASLDWPWQLTEAKPG